MTAYWEIVAHTAYDMLYCLPFSQYKSLSVTLVFPHLGFWSGNFFPIAPFPDHCLLLHLFNLCTHIGR